MLPTVSVAATTGLVVRLVSVVEETEAVSVRVIAVIETVDAELVRSPLTESLVLGLPPLKTLLEGSAAFGHKATTPLPSKNNWIKVAGSATVPWHAELMRAEITWRPLMQSAEQGPFLLKSDGVQPGMRVL